MQSKYDLVPSLNEEAAAAIVRMGGDVNLEGQRRVNLGLSLSGQGKYDEALRELDSALPLLENAHGRMSREVARCLHWIGTAHLGRGNEEEAWNAYHQGLEIDEVVLGSHHPDVASLLDGAGSARYFQLRIEEAGAYFERAVRIKEDALGPDSPLLAGYLNNLATIRIEQGRPRDVLPHLQRALSLLAKELDSKNPRLVYPLAGLGEAYLALGDRQQAREYLERALDVRGDAYASRALAWAQFNLAKALWDSPGARRRGHALALEARDVYRKSGNSPLEVRNLRRIEQWLTEHPADEGSKTTSP